jgi:hypothetical protein
MIHEPRKDEPIVTAGRDRSSESIPDLIRDLATDLSTLFGKEVQLAKSEVRETVSDVQIAVGAIASGAVIAMAGLVILLLSAVYGLSNVLAPWLAALIVGASALLVGYLMVNGAKKKMSESSVVPERTLESIKKDTETLTKH